MLIEKPAALANFLVLTDWTYPSPEQLLMQRCTGSTVGLAGHSAESATGFIHILCTYAEDLVPGKDRLEEGKDRRVNHAKGNFLLGCTGSFSYIIYVLWNNSIFSPSTLIWEFLLSPS